jgi:GDP-L-fucose synthase
MPTNLYGPNDTYDLKKSHVLPALLRKFVEAKRRKDPGVTIWGTGTPRREFLHVDDLAEACVFLMEHYHDPGPVNVGTGSDLTISELAEKIQTVTGYTGQIIYDRDKPDGMRRKLLDVSKINALGWSARISLDEGLERTYHEVKEMQWND